MFRSIFSVSLLLFADILLANNQIHIMATVPAHAETQMKMTHIDSGSIKEDVYLKTNYNGLTISLSDAFSHSSPLINYAPLTTTPITFSDDSYKKSTKIAELIISQKENKGSLGVTISVK